MLRSRSPQPKIAPARPRYPRLPVLVALAVVAAGSAVACGAAPDGYDEDAGTQDAADAEQDGSDEGGDGGRVPADAGVSG
jgi:hypothetical protein